MNFQFISIFDKSLIYLDSKGALAPWAPEH